MAQRLGKIVKILSNELYEKQLKDILKDISASSYDEAKKFKLYLDTIIVNIPTKAKKYKQSFYSEDKDIRDVEYEGYTIPFLFDEIDDTYLILAILIK